MKILNKIEDRFTLLSTILLLVAGYRLFFFILLVAVGAASISRYTYWNYLIQTVFYILLVIGYKFNFKKLLKGLAFFIFPIIFNSVFFVFSYIIIILQLDKGELFIEATDIDGGSVSVGTVHTMDHILHTFIVIDFLIVMLSGYVKYVRKIMHKYYSRIADSRWSKFFFFMYHVISPLFPVSIYSMIFNPTEEYPTAVHPTIPLLIGLSFYFSICCWTHALLITKRYGVYKKIK